MIRVSSVDGPAVPPQPPIGALPPPGTAAPHGAVAAPEVTPPAGWPTEAGAGAYPIPPYPVPEPDRFTRFVVRLYDRSPRWAVPLAALGCVALGIGYTLITDPTRSDPTAAPSCVLKLTTGLDCPGCGGTRALWYVLHGDVPAAARHHFLLVFALPFLAYLFVAWAGRQAFGWRLPELRVSNKLIAGFLAAWLAFSVLRNLPLAPFTSLYV
ncbi:DUF2752 domain-containing protein [Micromonospora musae]|uniref:DUF2752 domain-containing protein n=1 Tax=Micromonospora musae TaxID=1894970 RepID=UPI003F4DA3D5